MKKTSLLLLFIMMISIAYGQTSSPQIISPSGDNLKGNNIQLDWTLGEIAITTIQNSSQQITQGFHQPIYTITTVSELPLKVGFINVYPNPTSESIEMNLQFKNIRDVSIILFSQNSRIVWERNENGQEIHLVENIAKLPNGTYYLNFTIDGNKYSKTIKIQKIN